MHTLMLSPFSVARGLVMNPCQKFEVLNRDLSSFDSKFMVQFALGSPLDARDGLIQLNTSLAGYSKWMRTACVCPHVWECDLFRCALLEKQFVLGVEEEDRECAVEETFVDVGHEMA